MSNQGSWFLSSTLIFLLKHAFDTSRDVLRLISSMALIRQSDKRDNVLNYFRPFGMIAELADHTIVIELEVRVRIRPRVGLNFNGLSRHCSSNWSSKVIHIHFNLQFRQMYEVYVLCIYVCICLCICIYLYRYTDLIDRCTVKNKKLYVVWIGIS